MVILSHDMAISLVIDPERLVGSRFAIGVGDRPCFSVIELAVCIEVQKPVS